MELSGKSGAWWSGTFQQFLDAENEYIIGKLSSAASSRGLAATPEQMASWEETVSLLRSALGEQLDQKLDIRELGVVLEFEIPRRARRIDVALITNESVLVIEMKVGSATFDRAAQIQAIDYALDLLDFHSQSTNRRVTPVLVATAAIEDGPDADPLRGSLAVRNVAPTSLGSLVMASILEDTLPGVAGVDLWISGSYSPTPNILEAAREVFAGHKVAEISMANANNLTDTVTTIAKAVESARSSKGFVICFVTGIPGSGKTLTGLSAAHMTGQPGEDPTFAYLSGNGPLVDVLRYAIAKDRAFHNPDVSLEKALRETTVLIQHVRDFLDHYLNVPSAPAENVIVFDEAQRAWDARQMKNKSRSGVERSQAEIALEVMRRRDDWAVIVALVGNGQEINRGEAGIEEWFKALESSKDWSIWTDVTMVPMVPTAVIERVTVDKNLHLNVVTRAPRGEKLTLWVDALLRCETDQAAALAPEIVDFPLLITRDLEEARDFLRDCASDDTRVGVVATSQDRRLRAFGIERSTAFIRSIKWPMWFVHDRTDTRSSYSLEVAASEFECQGLEIDYALVCWGADLIPGESGWIGRRFKGDRWLADKDPELALNRYRVLLTRARKGMVIWVPDTGGREILKLDNHMFNSIAAILEAAGVKRFD